MLVAAACNHGWLMLYVAGPIMVVQATAKPGSSGQACCQRVQDPVLALMGTRHTCPAVVAPFVPLQVAALFLHGAAQREHNFTHP